MGKNNDLHSHGRREFLAGAGALAGLSMLASLPGTSFAEQLGISNQAGLSVKQVMDIALSGFAANPRSVDLLKFGSPDQVVTGIVTTTFPTIEVVNKAIKAGANLIVSHEALFYGLDDNAPRLKDSDVVKYKTDLLTKNNIAVFRFHDAWHAQKIDGITWGSLIKLGWDKYYDPTNPKMITLPKAITLGQAVTLSKKALNAPQVRVIGDLNKPVKTVYLAIGSVPSAQVIPDIQKFKPDLVLNGEIREWETSQRIKDGIAMGLNTKQIVLGHAISEEAGMEYAANWLKPKVQGTKVTYIASGTPFQYV
jgi:putative NIF3 family GTP cyclohydrolase 1 type 2